MTRLLVACQVAACSRSRSSGASQQPPVGSPAPVSHCGSSSFNSAAVEELNLSYHNSDIYIYIYVYACTHTHIYTSNNMVSELL